MLKWKILLTIFFTIVKSESDLKVCLDNLGCLVGTEMPGLIGDDNFEAFLGVPYAKPPIGDLRFRNPEPVEPWQGDLMVDTAKPDCKQRNYLMTHWPISGDEDCLYMNIYRPKDHAESHLPVLFYIHGGGLFSGSAHPALYGPEYFMAKRQVIVVVITYRLGPFGFLSSGCSALPGNFGFKDQLLALQWVHEHITEFGGNPGEMTLFGHSAGASSVHFHMINPRTEGLFKQAILSSGNALAPFVEIVDKPLEQLHLLAHALGVTSDHTPNELAAHLRSLDADDILKAGDILKFWHNHDLFNFGPVLEHATDENSYLIEPPLKTISKGNYHHRPWLTGLVSYSGEGAAITLGIHANQTLRNELNHEFDEKMMKLLDLHSLEKLNILIDEYMQGIHELNDNTGDGFLELFSDYDFFYPVYRTLKHHFDYADNEQAPAFIYKFSYHGRYTYAPFFAGDSTHHYDVVHLDDTLYQFRQSILFPDYEKDSVDQHLAQEFVDILLAFIKNGEPLHYTDIGPCTKEQFLTSGSKGMCKYLEFVNTAGSYEHVVNDAYHFDRMQLWDTILT